MESLDIFIKTTKHAKYTKTTLVWFVYLMINILFLIIKFLNEILSVEILFIRLIRGQISFTQGKEILIDRISI